MPERVRLSRRKGWRKPENTVVVARPTRWGNPFVLVWDDRILEWMIRDPQGMLFGHYALRRDAAADAVACFRDEVLPGLDVAALRGKNVACWCPLDQPCHADVLLEIANGGADEV